MHEHVHMIYLHVDARAKLRFCLAAPIFHNALNILQQPSRAGCALEHFQSPPRNRVFSRDACACTYTQNRHLPMQRENRHRHRTRICRDSHWSAQGTTHPTLPLRPKPTVRLTHCHAARNTTLATATTARCITLTRNCRD